MTVFWGSLLKKYIQSYLGLHLIFLIIAMILFLPLLLNGELVTWRDSQFHIARFHELIMAQQNGHFFPDIIKYSGTNSWGYGLNFFYPTYLFYPLIFLWRLTKLPVTSILIFDIIVVYFALWSNFAIVYKITSKIKLAFTFALTYVLTAAIGNAILDNVAVVRIAYMTQYASNIVILLAPVVVLSFYNIIFLHDNRTWLRAAIYSSFAVMLSIPTTLGIVLTVLCMVVVAYFKRQLSINDMNQLLRSVLLTLGLSAAFVFPFIEQRLANNWANLPNNPDLFGANFSTVLMRIFNLSDVLSLLIIGLTALLIFYKKFNHVYKILGLSYIVALLFLYSNLFPWYLFNRELSGALQMTYRWHFMPAILGSLFVAFAVTDLMKIKQKMLPIVSVMLIYLSFNGMMLNTVAKNCHVDGFNNATNHIVAPNKDNLKTDSLFGVTNDNIQVMLDRPSLALDDYRAQGQERNAKRIYSDSLVQFDKQILPNRTMVKGQDFYIIGVPRNTRSVQTPITYLKGFAAFDTQGKRLKAYKNKGGFLSVNPNGAKTIRLTYHKTLVHQISLIIFIITWLALGGYWLIYFIKGMFYTSRLKH